VIVVLNNSVPTSYHHCLDIRLVFLAEGAAWPVVEALNFVIPTSLNDFRDGNLGCFNGNAEIFEDQFPLFRDSCFQKGVNCISAYLTFFTNFKEWGFFFKSLNSLCDNNVSVSGQKFFVFSIKFSVGFQLLHHSLGLDLSVRLGGGCSLHV